MIKHSKTSLAPCNLLHFPSVFRSTSIDDLSSRGTAISVTFQIAETVAKSLKIQTDSVSSAPSPNRETVRVTTIQIGVEHTLFLVDCCVWGKVGAESRGIRRAHRRRDS